MLRAVILNILLILSLSACAPQTKTEPFARTETALPAPVAAPVGTPMAQTPAPMSAPVKVAILVPQSGPSAPIGEALLQAAQLAVFDLNEPNFTLIPKDTKGTAAGAAEAVNEAAREGATLILGPLFAQEVEGAKGAARSHGLTVLGFSTDWRVAGDHVYSMGVLPFGQAERIADYAARQGLRRIGVIAPRDMYGDAVVGVFEQTAKRYGISIVKSVRIAADGSDAMSAVTQLTGGQSATGAYDGLFMPVGGQTIHMLAATLKGYGLGSNQVRYLGTGLWDEAGVMSDANMSGALYAAPSPTGRAGFERNYQRFYGSMPPRLASIGYDSAALAIVLARAAAQSGSRAAYDRASLTNANRSPRAYKGRSYPVE